MRRDGFVSVWVGHAESRQRLLSFVEERYPDDLAVPVSELAEAIGVTYYDEDGREVNFLNAHATTVAEALKGCSYGERVVSELVRLRGDALPEGVNCSCLLYNFEPDVVKPQLTAAGIHLLLLGVVRYR